MTDEDRNYELTTRKQSQIDAPVLSYEPLQPRRIHRIGLVGCGGISENHLAAYRHAGFEVVALADIVSERAEKRREQFFAKADVSADYRDLLHRNDMEVVDVATHPEQRVEIIEDFLQAGKHVLSQKPFVLDLATGQRLAQLAEDKGLCLAVNQNGRWAPHFSYIREAVKAGIVGDVASVNMSVHWDHNWIQGTRFDQLQHVILQDFAIHWFDFVASIVPATADRVYATIARSPSQAARPPLIASVVLEYPQTRCTLTFDADSVYGPEDRTAVRGTLGSLYSVGPNLTEQIVTGYTSDGWFQPKLSGEWFLEGFQGTMAELMNSIEENSVPRNGARDNLRGLAMCFAAARSADLREPVSVASMLDEV